MPTTVRFLMTIATIIGLASVAHAESSFPSGSVTQPASSINRATIGLSGTATAGVLTWYLGGRKGGNVLSQTPPPAKPSAKPLPHPVSKPYGATISGGVPGMVQTSSGAWVSAQGSCC
jgi:hypothetical protein